MGTMMQDMENRLHEAVASRDHKKIMQALGSIAQVKMGMAELADATGLPKASLYRNFRDQSNPKLESLLAILEALDLDMMIKPKQR